MNIGPVVTDMRSTSQYVFNTHLDATRLQGNKGPRIAHGGAAMPFRSDTFHGAILNDVVESVAVPFALSTTRQPQTRVNHMLLLPALRHLFGLN